MLRELREEELPSFEWPDEEELPEKEGLVAVLPIVSGWDIKNISYRKIELVKGAHLKADYLNIDDRKIEVDIIVSTDSFMLSTFKIIIELNISSKTEMGYERITYVNSTPATEKFDKQRQETELMFIYKEHYLVRMVHAGEDSVLKKFARKFDQLQDNL